MRLTRVASTIAVVLLLLMAGVALTAAIVGERLLAAVIERTGPAAVGRKVGVGTVTIDWGRFTAVAIADLVVADAPWSASPALLRIRRATFTIDLLDLLRLRLSLVRLGLQKPVLHLTRNAEGRWNLPQAGSGGAASGGRVADGLAALRGMEMEDGELVVDDLASPGVEGAVTAFSARMPHPAGGIEFGGMAGRGGGTPVTFSGQIGSIAKLLHGGDDGAEPFPIRLTAGPGTARVSATGHLARPLDLAGIDLRIQGQGDDLAPLLAAFAVGSATPAPPFHLSARLTDNQRGWELGDVTARFGESRIRGKAGLSLGPPHRRRVSLNLVAPRIVLSDLDWLARVGGRREAPSGSLLDAPLPTALLRWADADGDLRVERLDGLVAGPASLRLGFELDGGHLRVHPLRASIAKAEAEGTAAIDVSGGVRPNVVLRLNAGDVQLGPLLAAFGIEQVAGRLLAASVDVHGRA